MKAFYGETVSYFPSHYKGLEDRYRAEGDPTKAVGYKRARE